MKKLTRKNFLKTTAAATAWLATKPLHGAVLPQKTFNKNFKNMQTIDTHAHLWNNEYLDALKDLGSGGTDVARDLKATDTAADMKERLRMMDTAGVKMQVLSATPQSPEWGTEQDAEKVCRMINDLYAAVMQKYPGRFIAYAALPLPFVDASIREIRRVLDKPGFKGVAINTLIQNKISPAEEKFLPIYEELNKRKTIVYYHPTGCGANSPMVKDFKLDWVVGAPIEDLLLPLQLLKADIPGKFKDIKFHLAHLGGGLAFQMQRIEDNFEDWKAFKHSPWKTLNNFHYDAANFHAPALECSCKTFGVSQHMMGSDFPYFQDEKYTRAAEYIAKADLTEAQIQDILVNNAKKLYGL